MAGVGLISGKQIAKALKSRPLTPADARKLRTLGASNAAIAQGFNVPQGFASGAALGTALATTGFDAELGLFYLNPYTAIPAAIITALDLAGVIPGLAGKPKMLDTVQAVARLFQSRDPEIQQLAKNLAILVKNDAPLSSGNPRIQAQIRDWIGGAVGTILERYGLQNNGNAAGELDNAIRAVLTSERSAPGSLVDNVIARFAGQRAPFRIPPLRAQPLGQTRPQPFLPPAPAPMPPPLPPPAPINFQPPEPTPPLPPPAPLFQYLDNLQREHPYLELAGCVALAAAGQIAATEFCLTELLKAQTERAAQNILRGARNFVRSLLNRQLTPMPPPPLPPPPLMQPQDGGQHHLLELNRDGTDWARPCPACDRIARQRGEIQTEIETETQQDVQSQLDQIQEQIDQLQQLEQQPAQSRNITQELAQKRQLLNRLTQLQSEATGQQTNTFPLAQPNPQPELPPHQGQLTLTCPDGYHPAHTPEESAQYGDCAPDNADQGQSFDNSKAKMQFCVGCNSEEDAILFLNGEPSQCSVIPGSTKPI